MNILQKFSDRRDTPAVEITFQFNSTDYDEFKKLLEHVINSREVPLPVGEPDPIRSMAQWMKMRLR